MAKRAHEQKPQPMPKPSDRWGDDLQNRKQNREQQFALKRMAILRTAARLFSERGYRETSLNDLAKLLGVTKPTLYYYVKSKDDILFQCLDVAMKEIRATLTEANRSHKTGLQKLRIFAERYVKLLTGDFGKCLVLAGITPLKEDNRVRLAVGFREIDRVVKQIVAEGVKDGSIARCDLRMVTFAYFGALHWITKWYRTDGTRTPEQIADGLFAVFEAGLQPR